MSDVQITGIGAWRGGTVVDLAVYGDTVLAATFAGIFRSADGGQTWLPVGANLPDWFVQTVALAPVGEQALGLAASHLGWLYRSTNTGETWEMVSFWHELGIITRLVPSPTFASDGIVLACTEEDGIFKSTDRGVNWKQASFGLLNLNVTALCFSPNFEQDEIVFAGTDGGGLFRSRNAGRAWRESGEGLPDSAVQCLAVSPDFAEDGVVLAGTEDEGLYRSTDGGRTWSPLGERPSETCFNGLYLPPGWVDGATVIAATDEGLLFSNDGGETWQAAMGGTDYPYVVVPCGSGFLAGSYEEGVHRSADGQTWHDANGDLAAHLPPMVCFSDDFERDGTVVMGSMEGTLVRSEDAGQTWEALPGGDEWSLSALASAGAGRGMVLYAAAEAHLLASADGGQAWRSMLNTGEDLLTALAFHDGTVVAGTAGGQVLLSPDRGASWAQAALFSGETVVTLAAWAGPGDAATYAVTAQRDAEGTWALTLRGGAAWDLALARTADEPVAALHLLGADRVLCSMGRRVLYVEGGSVVAESEIQGDAPVTCLARAGGAILAGSRWGLQRSTDQARSWAWLTAGISVVALCPSGPDRAYVVAMGGRLWQVDLP